MDIQEYKTQYYFFKPNDFGNIFVFVDFGNVRPWAKDFWPEENKYRLCSEIDIKKLSDVCNWVQSKQKFFYYGYFQKVANIELKDSGNEKYRKSIYRIDKAKKAGFKIRSKEIKMIPHYDESGKFIGKIPKCNFDVGITMDIITKINRYDSVMLFSGDSDFGNLLDYIKSKGKKTIVVCTRNRMSNELEAVADKFIPAETLKDFLKYDSKQTLRPIRAEV